MKILFINGSPNPDGATAAILSVIRQTAEEKAHDCRTVCLGEQNIHFCIGCKACYETGVCCQRDDMDKLHAAMEEADAIVMGLPSYWGDMPGHAKVFIDRTTPCCDTNAGHSTFSDGKVGYAVAVRAGPTTRESDHLIASVEHFFGHLHIEMKGSAYLTLADTKEQVLARKNEILAQCENWF